VIPLGVSVEIDGPEIPAALLTDARAAVAAGLRQWANDPRGLGLRFTVAAYGLYGYTPRAAQKNERSPEPYVGTGALRDRLVGGGTTVDVQGGADAFEVAMTSEIPRSLRNAGTGLYGQEWTRLHPAEADAIDRRVQAAINAAEGAARG
jgi:hypothetical protein